MRAYFKRMFSRVGAIVSPVWYWGQYPITRVHYPTYHIIIHGDGYRSMMLGDYDTGNTYPLDQIYPVLPACIVETRENPRRRPGRQGKVGI